MPVVSTGRGPAPVAYGPCWTARLLYLPAVPPGSDHPRWRIVPDHSPAAELVKRPFPCQFRAATWRDATSLRWAVAAVSPGELLCGVVAVTSAVTDLPHLPSKDPAAAMPWMDEPIEGCHRGDYTVASWAENRHLPLQTDENPLTRASAHTNLTTEDDVQVQGRAGRYDLEPVTPVERLKT